MSQIDADRLDGPPHTCLTKFQSIYITFFYFGFDLLGKEAADAPSDDKSSIRNITR